MHKLSVTAMAIACLVSVGSGSAALAAVKTGEAAPDFTLSDVNGTPYKLSEHLGKVIVLEWTNYDCPFVRKFYSVGAMQKLQAEMTAKGVVWLSINSSAPGKQGNFTQEVWLQRIQDDNVAVPVLLDPDGKVGKTYGAKTTPHMFVINAEGKIAYQGAIDSIRSTNADDIPKAENHVDAAIKAILAGEPVAKPETDAYGCSVKY